MIHQSLYAGLQLVVMPKFDLEDFCRFIQEHKITFAYVVPPVVLLLGKHPVIEKYDLSTIRMMNSGAAPLTRELVDAVNKRLGIPIKQGYGLSETSPTTHTQPWEGLEQDHRVRRHPPPLPDCQVHVARGEGAAHRRGG
jgi:4-coumarate--CoA ligase